MNSKDFTRYCSYLIKLYLICLIYVFIFFIVTCGKGFLFGATFALGVEEETFISSGQWRRR